MLQINTEFSFKSINEKHALTFLISTAWRKITNVSIFFVIFSLFTSCLISLFVFFIVNKKNI